MTVDKRDLKLKHIVPKKIIFNGQEVNSVEFADDVRWRTRVIATDSEYSMEDFFDDYGEMTEPPCEVSANRHLLAPIGMFKDCSALVKAPPFKAPKMENMHRMFYGCEKLSEVPPYNTARVYDFTDFVNGCQSLPKKFILDIHSVSNADRLTCAFEDSSVEQVFLLNPQVQVKKHINVKLLTGVSGAVDDEDDDDDDDDDDDGELDADEIKQRERSLKLKIVFGEEYRRVQQSKYRMKDLYPFVYSSMTEVIDAIDVEGITDISSMYEGCDSLTEIPWMDTSKVTNMSNAFKGCSKVTKVYTPDFSQVTNMSGLFYGCSSLSDDRFPSLETATKVTDISFLFYDCHLLTHLPTIPMANVTDMTNAFKGTSITSVDEFDFSKVKIMRGLFEGCIHLSNVEDFVTSSATNMSRLFGGCTSLEYIPIIDIASITSPEGLRGMLDGTKVREIRFANAPVELKPSITPVLLGKPDVTVLFGGKRTIVGEDHGMDVVYGDVYESMTHIPDELDTSQLKFTYSMFADMGELVDVPMMDISGSCDCSEMFQACTSLKKIPPLDTGSCEEFVSMFEECYSLTEVPIIDIGCVTTANNLRSMFKKCGVTSVTFLNPSEKVKNAITPALLRGVTIRNGQPVSEVKDIKISFIWTHHPNLPLRVLTDDTCHIQELYPTEYEDMTEAKEAYDTTQITDMTGMYQNCKSLQKPDYHYTTNVVCMSGMFDNCVDLEEVPLYNTSNVVDMSAMFSQCTSLATIPKFDTSKVVDFSDMFYNCWSLNKIPAIKTSSAKCMIDMFFGCSDLKSVPALDISSIEKPEDMRDMFFGTGVTRVSFSNASPAVKSGLTPAILGKSKIRINFIAKK